MLDKISKCLWITLYFASLVFCIVILISNYQLTRFDLTVQQSTDSEIRAKEFVLSFLDKAEKQLEEQYLDAIHLARSSFNESIEEYKNGLMNEQRQRFSSQKGEKKKSAVKIEVDQSTNIETMSFSTIYDVDSEKLFESSPFNIWQSQLIDECRGIITDVLTVESEIVEAFDKIDIEKMSRDIKFKYKQRNFVILGVVKPKKGDNEALVLISEQLFLFDNPSDARKIKIELCCVIIEEYYHCLDPELNRSSYRFK